jgi:hypothetical protein
VIAILALVCHSETQYKKIKHSSPIPIPTLEDLQHPNLSHNQHTPTPQQQLLSIMTDKDTSNQPPSTIGAYVDSAIGGAQEIVGKLIGNPTDQVSSTPHTRCLANAKLSR